MRSEETAGESSSSLSIKQNNYRGESQQLINIQIGTSSGGGVGDGPKLVSKVTNFIKNESPPII
jgi:hypothetical protein